MTMICHFATLHAFSSLFHIYTDLLVAHNRKSYIPLNRLKSPTLRESLLFLLFAQFTYFCCLILFELLFFSSLVKLSKHNSVGTIYLANLFIWIFFMLLYCSPNLVHTTIYQTFQSNSGKKYKVDNRYHFPNVIFPLHSPSHQNSLHSPFHHH